jgi:hypothetical protein
MNIMDAKIGDLLSYLDDVDGGEFRFTGEDEETGEVSAVVIVATGPNALDVLDALSDWEVQHQVKPLVS